MQISFKFFLLITISHLITIIGYGQTDSSNTVKMLESSVQEVMKLPVETYEGQKIFSASKSLENLFNAPLNSYVITREDMYRAGVTNIAEAMRLVPGVIVRETTNGNYDIHWRGMDNMVPYSGLIATVAKGVLVMIDGRSVYDHWQGGVFWETIPIDIQDIEQMEVVLGPSSTLYGANAVLGVLNIITRKDYEKDVNVSANLQYGSFNTFLANMAVAQVSNNQKWTFSASGNIQQRNRFDSRYYRFSDGALINIDTLPNTYPNPSIATKKHGLNTSLSFKPNSNVQMRLSAGLENSDVQKVFLASTSSLIYSISHSYYIDYQTQIKKLRGQFSYNTGTRDFKIGTRPYDFDLREGSLDYGFDKIKNLVITPTLFYRRVAYRDTPHDLLPGLLGSQNWKIIDNYAASLKLDYKWKDKIRIVAALRADKFTYPDKLNYSYQGIITYTPLKNHLLRFVLGKANVGSWIANTFLNINISLPFNSPPFTTFQLSNVGNTNLQLTSQQNIELGYRVNIKNKINIDLTLFSSKTENFSWLVQTDLNFFSPPAFIAKSQMLNLPMIAYQKGIILNVDIRLNKFQFQPFVTFQQTYLKNFTPYFNLPATNPNDNIEKTFDIEHKATPSFYGGFILNYQTLKRLNLNLNAYFFDKHTIYGNSVNEANNFNTENETGAKIAQTFILNAKLGYKLNPKLTIFGNVRNLFANNYQHYFTDVIQTSYLCGFNFDM